MANVPPTGGPEYRTSYMVRHGTKDKWVVVADKRNTWTPMLFVDSNDPIDVAVAAAKAGLGAPKELTARNTYDPNLPTGVMPELTLAYVVGKDAVNQWVAREAYDKIQEIASTSLTDPINLTPHEVAELYNEAKDMLEHPNNPLKGAIEEQISDLEATLRAQYQLEDQAEEVLAEANANWSETDKAFAQAELERQVKASEALEARLEILDAASEGLRPQTKAVPYPGVDDEQMRLDIHAGTDALAKDLGIDPDEPGAQAEPAVPNKPTGPSDSGAEAELPDITEPYKPNIPGPDLRPPEPGHMGTQSHAEAMEFAKWSMAQNGIGPSVGTPISELGKSNGMTPTEISARTFPHAHEAAYSNKPQLAKSTVKSKGKAAGKTLKRGRR